MDLEVPEVLLSGDHAAIKAWRRREMLKRTLARRPDILAKARLSAEDRRILEELETEQA
jgi:tRNA (guanine37-N1)-methyltransferase